MTTMGLLLAASSLCGPMVISEVMFHPHEDSEDAEFVELVNLGDTVIDLTGWSLADLYAYHKPDPIRGDRLLLEPGAYGVIFETDYDTTDGSYHELIPGNALILFVDDNQIGNGLGNAGDTLFLINALGDTVDMMGWEQDIVPGYSLEKVVPDDCTLPGNWRSSISLHGTPGGLNSVAGQVTDLGLDALDWQAVPAPRGFAMTATVTNYGLAKAGGQLLAGDTAAADVPSLSVGESRVIPFDWEVPGGILGLYPLTIRLTVADDYDTSNNSLQIEVPIAASDLSVAVNEIMYTPLTGEPEWVELVNTTTSEVNLKDWHICDQSNSTGLPEQTLLSGGYVVITSDSTGGIGGWLPDIFVIFVPDFPALNNTGDQIVLLDPNAVVIDQVDYGLFALTSAGRSLEKVSPTAPSQEATSWVISPAPQGHTAGGRNSVLLDLHKTELTLEPNPLRLNTPESILAINYVTHFPAINLLVEIYDLAGRRLGTIFNEGPIPGAGVVTWDARSVDQVRYRTGQYVLLFRARDAGSDQRWERVERLILVN
ncbi:MAG: lamin tail domain-containing protein [Fidelibacterota bacterium]|nr:MAG: lamin tail domain-containing protein [Candidatus Neomarinimicrobiota bacterium]